MSSKEIKKEILNSNNNINLYKYFNDYPNETISAIYNSIYVLLKEYNNNRIKINNLIDFINLNYLSLDINILKHIINCSMYLETNIINNFKTKERSYIKNSLRDLDNIINKINIFIKILELIPKELDNLSILENLIFNIKDISVLEEYLKIIPNNNREVNNNIFIAVLNKYVLCCNKEDIDYYKKIIFLLLKYNKLLISNNSKQYINILSNYQDKQHIRDLLLFINNYNNKYDLSFSISNKLNNCNINERVSFINQECITIDGKNDTCLDDALYLEKKSNGTYTLFVHIADLPSQVPYNSDIDISARRKVETLYLKDTNILMYPDNISNNICSLLPNDFKNVITYIVDLDSNMDIIFDSFKIKKGIIYNRHKLSYNEVDIILNQNSTSSLDIMIKNLARFAYKQKISNPAKEKYRKYKETISSDNIKQNSNNNIYINSYSIVEETMVLINYLVSKKFSESNLPYIYRTFNTPNEYYFDIIINEYLKDNNMSRIDEYTINSLKDSLVHSMYSIKPSPHDGLNLLTYSHSTSPIRRYPDSYCQYIIYDLIFNNIKDDKIIYNWEENINSLVNYLNIKRQSNIFFKQEYNNSPKSKIRKLQGSGL